MLASVGERLPAPKTGDDIEGLIQQFGPPPNIRDFPETLESGVGCTKADGKDQAAAGQLV